MSTDAKDTVPEPARAPGLRPRVKSRTAKAVVAGVLLAVTIALVWSCAGPMSEAGFGPVARNHAMVPWWPRVPFLKRRITLLHTARVPADAVWLSTFGADPGLEPFDEAAPMIPALCGCQYRAHHIAFTGAGVTVHWWSGWPREEPVLRVTWGPPSDRQTITLDNPSSGTTPMSVERPLLPLPWEGEIGNARVLLREKRSDGKTQITIGTERLRDGAAPVRVFRDSKGNSYRLETWQDDYPMTLPFGAALCPHSAWWEMEATPPGGAPVTFRFAPPR